MVSILIYFNDKGIILKEGTAPILKKFAGKHVLKWAIKQNGEVQVVGKKDENR